MTIANPPSPAISIPSNFEFGEVLPQPRVTGPAPAPPSLGALAAFVGNWSGSGFNCIFRPQNAASPANLPTPVAGDNVLEINLTSDNIAFSPSLGTVPNRGEVQGDIFLNGVPYLQTVSDVTNPSQPVGIHVEPGLWMCVVPTSDPDEVQTLVRMASIPHGTTIVAQGTSSEFTGAPNIPPVNITPFITSEGPGSPIAFASQTVTSQDTARIPQDLTSFNAAGTITQAILNDPNSILRSHNSNLVISGGTQISISTNPALPLFGGGADNIAFLLGNPGILSNPNPAGPNAQTLQMSATFWIETVEHTIIVPPIYPGDPPLTVHPTVAAPNAPSFLVRPPFPISEQREITVTSTQIQYSQLVLLNFNGLSWPHVSLATLVPAGPVTVPPTVW